MSRIYGRLRAKIDRAKQHLQDFNLGLQAFYKTNPYEVSSKEDANTGQRIYYLVKADPVPDPLTAIAADILFNLRTPLDHIAYQAVLESRSGTKPDWLVYYPICATAKDYPSVRTKVKGIRKELLDAIDATEPYEGGKGHALWQLNALHKPDKHELLVGASTLADVDISSHFKDAFKSMGVDLPEIPSVFIKSADKTGLRVGDTVFTEPIDPKPQHERKFACYVAFDDARVVNGEPALKTLQDIANLVDDIVARIGKLFS